MKQQHSYSEQIKQRAIKPSEGSWKKLSEKLSANEHLQKSKKWVFMKYAASILILISVGFYFFQPKHEIIEGDIIVAPTLEEQFIKSPVLNQTPETLIAIPVKISPIITTHKTQPKVDEVVVFQEISSIKESEISFENSEKSIVVTKENSTIVVASSDEVTDSEIEQLLNNATTNFKNDLQNLNKDVVSANTLLLEVEDDLNKDFKQKMFESVVKSLSNLKEVVADNGNK
jgi:hypothetical protein